MTGVQTCALPIYLKYGLTKTIAYFDELLKDQGIQTSVSGASVV